MTLMNLHITRYSFLFSQDITFVTCCYNLFCLTVLTHNLISHFSKDTWFIPSGRQFYSDKSIQMWSIHIVNSSQIITIISRSFKIDIALPQTVAYDNRNVFSKCGGQKSKWICRAVSSGGPRGESVTLTFLASRGHMHSLAADSILHVQSSLTSFSLFLSSFCRYVTFCLTLTLLPPSYKDDLMTRGPTRIIQDNLPKPKSLTWLHLQNPLYHLN